MPRGRALKNTMRESGSDNTKGSLHKALGMPQDKKIPEKKLEKATHSKNHLTRKRANLAETIRGFKH